MNLFVVVIFLILGFVCLLIPEVPRDLAVMGWLFAAISTAVLGD